MMTGYQKMPKHAVCETCGKKNSIKLASKKSLPPGVDGIGFSRCSTCATQSIHFAGPENIVRQVAEEFLAFQGNANDQPVSITSRHI